MMEPCTYLPDGIRSFPRIKVLQQRYTWGNGYQINVEGSTYSSTPSWDFKGKRVEKDVSVTALVTVA